MQIATDAFGNALGNSIVSEATDRAARHLTEEQDRKLKQAHAEWQREEREGFGRQKVLLAANDDAGGDESDTRSITLEAFNKAKETNASGVFAFGIDRYSPRFGTTFLADGTEINPYAQQAAVALGGGFAVLDSSLPAITASGFDGPAGEVVRNPLGFAAGNLKSLRNNKAGFAGALLIQSAVGQAQAELEMSGALLRMDVSDVQNRISGGGDYLSELITARPRSGAEGVGMMTGDVTSLMSGVNGFRKSRSWEDVISSSMRKDPALNKLLGIDDVHRGW
ncbi:hypothetical protein [Achromobacter pulmonis]|uniref:hypothetical protein n=1 Tax=Achromobacter pulmonis TaxID=1389932 RepID=UPI0015819F75|nr:hypothetical protein [Achromobacter pulmonis]MCF7769896.1 hypothetical protein [Achromobacter pulmonis]